MNQRQLSYFFRQMSAWIGKWETPPVTELEWGQALLEAETIWNATGPHPLAMQLIQPVLLYWEQSIKEGEANEVPQVWSDNPCA